MLAGHWRLRRAPVGALTVAKVECSTRVESDDYQTELTPAELRSWLADVPDHARLEVINGTRGSQFDPVPFLRGMVARWEEDR